MREILFRGKSLKNGEFVEGHYFKNDSGTFIFTFPYHANYADIDIMVKADPETVGQYTGVNDKNGKKIFEGDIVEATSGETGNSCRYEVCFSATDLWFGFRSLGGGYIYSLYELVDEELGADISFEVIGNIHDNPDILENHEEEN